MEKYVRPVRKSEPSVRAFFALYDFATDGRKVPEAKRGETLAQKVISQITFIPGKLSLSLFVFFIANLLVVNHSRDNGFLRPLYFGDRK